jgi:cytochrome c oxidase subunit 2
MPSPIRRWVRLPPGRRPAPRRSAGDRVVDPLATRSPRPPATGKGVPGSFPALDGSPVVSGPAAAQIATELNGVERDGKPTAMVGFKQLSDTDLASVITYTRNSWGNHTGEAVQPSAVRAARK